MAGEGVTADAPFFFLVGVFTGDDVVDFVAFPLIAFRLLGLLSSGSSRKIVSGPTSSSL